MATTREIGYEGEAQAETYLESQGYQIIERNYTLKGGEIDLIAWDGPTLCFIEVKHHSREDYGTMLERINKSKQKKIIFVARVYLSRKGNPDCLCRFDVVTILRRPEGDHRIELIKDAFRWER
jgi:putative endonuclease